MECGVAPVLSHGGPLSVMLTIQLPSDQYDAHRMLSGGHGPVMSVDPVFVVDRGSSLEWIGIEARSRGKGDTRLVRLTA